MLRKKKGNNPISRELIAKAMTEITEEDAEELMKCRKIPKELMAEESGT